MAIKDLKTRRTEKEIKKSGGFGNYREDTGGGEPIPKGEKLTTEHRVDDQPRTDDGKFTYNAVNGKPLKDISKVHGKSRGTTIPPTLTSGENGLHFTGKKFSQESFEEAKKHYEKFKGEFYQKGDEVVFEGHIKLAKEDMIESLQEYIEDKGFKDYDVSDWDTKKGRHSKAEKVAIDKAQTKFKKQGELFVTDLKKDDIVNYLKKKKGANVPGPGATPTTPEQPIPTPGPEIPGEQPTIPQQETAVGAPSESTAPKEHKYSPEKIALFRDSVLKGMEGYNEEEWDDDRVEEAIDYAIEQNGGQDIFEEDTEDQQQEEENEKDKAMKLFGLNK